MFQYRQAIVRLRAGEAVREIARSRLMGRDKLYALKALAEARGWLDAAAQMPDDATVAASEVGTQWIRTSHADDKQPLEKQKKGCGRESGAWPGRQQQQPGLRRPGSVSGSN